VSQEDVRRVDAALLAYLRSAPFKGRLAYKPEKFVRQYAGFRRLGRPYVYINAFPSRDLLTFRVDATNKVVRSKVDPSKGLRFVCGGGDEEWGIEYDVRSRTFSGLRTNGGE
jgi:hypothetical protein